MADYTHYPSTQRSPVAGHYQGYTPQYQQNAEYYDDEEPQEEAYADEDERDYYPPPETEVYYPQRLPSAIKHTPYGAPTYPERPLSSTRGMPTISRLPPHERENYQPMEDAHYVSESALHYPADVSHPVKAATTQPMHSSNSTRYHGYSQHETQVPAHRAPPSHPHASSTPHPPPHPPQHRRDNDYHHQHQHYEEESLRSTVRPPPPTSAMTHTTTTSSIGHPSARPAPPPPTNTHPSNVHKHSNTTAAPSARSFVDADLPSHTVRPPQQQQQQGPAPSHPSNPQRAFHPTPAAAAAYESRMPAPSQDARPPPPRSAAPLPREALPPSSARPSAAKPVIHRPLPPPQSTASSAPPYYGYEEGTHRLPESAVKPGQRQPMRQPPAVPSTNQRPSHPTAPPQDERRLMPPPSAIHQMPYRSHEQRSEMDNESDALGGYYPSSRRVEPARGRPSSAPVARQPPVSRNVPSKGAPMSTSSTAHHPLSSEELALRKISAEKAELERLRAHNDRNLRRILSGTTYLPARSTKKLTSPHEPHFNYQRRPYRASDQSALNGERIISTSSNQGASRVPLSKQRGPPAAVPTVPKPFSFETDRRLATRKKSTNSHGYAHDVIRPMGLPRGGLVGGRSQRMMMPSYHPSAYASSEEAYYAQQMSYETPDYYAHGDEHPHGDYAHDSLGETYGHYHHGYHEEGEGEGEGEGYLYPADHSQGIYRHPYEEEQPEEEERGDHGGVHATAAYYYPQQQQHAERSGQQGGFHLQHNAGALMDDKMERRIQHLFGQEGDANAAQAAAQEEEEERKEEERAMPSSETLEHAEDSLTKSLQEEAEETLMISMRAMQIADETLAVTQLDMADIVQETIQMSDRKRWGHSQHPISDEIHMTSSNPSARPVPSGVSYGVEEDDNSTINTAKTVIHSRYQPWGMSSIPEEDPTQRLHSHTSIIDDDDMELTGVITSSLRATPSLLELQMEGRHGNEHAQEEDMTVTQQVYMESMKKAEQVLQGMDHMLPSNGHYSSAPYPPQRYPVTAHYHATQPASQRMYASQRYPNAGARW